MSTCCYHCWLEWEKAWWWDLHIISWPADPADPSQIYCMEYKNAEFQRRSSVFDHFLYIQIWQHLDISINTPLTTIFNISSWCSWCVEFIYTIYISSKSHLGSLLMSCTQNTHIMYIVAGNFPGFWSWLTTTTTTPRPEVTSQAKWGALTAYNLYGEKL